MTVRVAALAIDCQDPARMAAWWAEVLGYTVGGAEGDEAWIQDPAGKRDDVLFLKA